MAGKESMVLVGPRRYFNLTHAAEYCAVAPSWIEDRLRSGVLPYRWAGNRRRILRRNVDALMMGLLE